MAVVDLFAPPAAEIDAYVVDASLWTPIGKPWLVSLHALADDDTGLTLDIDGKVEQWDDLSGNGNHLTQSDPAKRFAYVASDSRTGGLPALMGSDVLSSARGLYTLTITARNAYVVAAYKSGAEAQYEGYPTMVSGDGPSGSKYIVGHISTSGILQSGSNAIASGLGRQNGSGIGVVNLPMPLSVLSFAHSEDIQQAFCIGYRLPASNEAWPGVFRAFALTDGTETEQEKQLFESWLARRSNIVSRLVETHPYRSSIGIQQTLTIVAPSDVIDVNNNAPGSAAFYTAMPDLATTPPGTIIRCINALVPDGIRRDPWFECIEVNAGTGYSGGDRDWDQIR